MSFLRIFTLIVVFGQCLITNNIHSQVTNPTNNYVFGRYVGFNASSTINPLEIRTNNIARMVINGGPVAATTGYIGIGNNFFGANQRLTVDGNTNLFNLTNGYMIGNQLMLWHNGGVTNVFVGIGSGAVHGSVSVGNTFVGSNAGANATGVGGLNTFIGNNAGFNNIIGDEYTFVGADAGSTVTQGSRATFIGCRAGQFAGGFSNGTFVGWEAGKNSLGNGSNTFMGVKSGLNNTTGINNCYFGHESGLNATGSDNCFFGNLAGGFNANYSRNTYVGGSSGATGAGDDNVFMGWSSGNWGIGSRNVAIGNFAMGTANGFTGGSDDNVVIGNNANRFSPGTSFNTIIGADAALLNNVGANNTFIGNKSGRNQTSGNNNSALGINTGLNVTIGNDNTFVGANADATNINSNLNNAAAIGANAKVTNNNHMIIGDNNVNVGIGLSTDITGPGNSLEINTQQAGLGAAPGGIIGSSGLRLRDMHSAGLPVTNPGKGVLAVDKNGDVIYVNAPIGGTTLGNLCSTPSSNPLTSSWEVPLNNFNYYFSDNVANTGSVSIGNNSCGTINARLDILNSSKLFSQYIDHNVNFNTPTGALDIVSSNSGNGATGGVRVNTITTGSGNVQGLRSIAQSTGGSAIGLSGVSNGGANVGNFAIGVSALSICPNPSHIAIGVNSNTANATYQSIAGNFDILNSSSPENYGLQTEILSGTNPASKNLGLQGIISNPGVINTGVQMNISGASGNNFGCRMSANGIGSSTNYGLTSGCAGITTGINYGGDFSVTGSSNRNYGIYSFAESQPGMTMNVNTGIASLTVNQNTSTSSINVGVYSEANNLGTTGDNVAVAGIAINSGMVTNFTNNTNPSLPPIINNIGIYGEGNWAGYFVGSVAMSGNQIIFSDEKIKSNVNKIESALDRIKELNPVTYNFKTKEFPELNLNENLQYGFIAQEVENVLPDMVIGVKKPEFSNKDGKIISKGGEYKGVNYIALIPLLTKGIQDQQKVISEQNKKLLDLQQQIDDLKKLITSTPDINNTNGITSYEIELNDKAALVLDQNVPNPFAEQTEINFLIPEVTKRAQLLFHNSSGQLMKTVELTERGKGKLTVFANDLSNGTYTYTLILDGKIEATKRMEKIK